MSKVYELFSELREEEMQSSISPVASITPDEEKKITEMALNQIHTKKYGSSTAKPASVKMRFSRRWVIVAASLVLVLGLGTIAYATDLFGFGKVQFDGTEVETASAEDSNQYLAMKDYNDWIVSLPAGESEKLIGEQIEHYKGYDGTSEYVISYRNPEKVAELANKYDLKVEKKYLYTDSAASMFSKAKMPDFLGSFADNIDPTGGLSDKNLYSYSDQGAIRIYAALADGSSVDISCVPNDVFRSFTALYFPLNSADIKSTDEKWNFQTGSGYDVRCSLVKSVLFAGEGEDEIAYDRITFAVAVGDSIVSGEIGSNDQKAFSKADLEKYLNEFDFAKLAD
ncbi:MAG: hypothetical protein LBN36_06075 [Clostridiales Family XIII bacterium]|jgi:hypothetical protein|nr:hypothetical protein [Clostridiales Family XIII bacterium]